MWSTMEELDFVPFVKGKKNPYYTPYFGVAMLWKCGNCVISGVVCKVCFPDLLGNIFCNMFL